MVEVSVCYVSRKGLLETGNTEVGIRDGYCIPIPEIREAAERVAEGGEIRLIIIRAEILPAPRK